MSGSFLVQHDGTTLVFEWDNAFSWLNEKTLDYHVSIQEPLTVQIQQVRRTERELKTRLKQLNEGVVLIQEEAKRRFALVATLQRLKEWEAMKEIQLTELKTRRTKVMEQKVQFQEEMDGLKANLAVLLAEHDELEDIKRRIMKVWNEAKTERDDVEMTLQLAGNGAQMESLAHELNDEIKGVRKQLACEVKMDEVVINREDDNSNGVGSKRQLAEPGVIAMNELLDTIPSEIDDAQHESRTESHKAAMYALGLKSRNFSPFHCINPTTVSEEDGGKDKGTIRSELSVTC
ncbi:putative GOLD domain superfamily protein [Plasmopara halstedii]